MHRHTASEITGSIWRNLITIDKIGILNVKWLMQELGQLSGFAKNERFVRWHYQSYLLYPPSDFGKNSSASLKIFVTLASHTLWVWLTYEGNIVRSDYRWAEGKNTCSHADAPLLTDNALCRFTIQWPLSIFSPSSDKNQLIRAWRQTQSSLCKGESSAVSHFDFSNIQFVIQVFFKNKMTFWWINFLLEN